MVKSKKKTCSSLSLSCSPIDDISKYQNGAVASPNVQIDGSNADCDQDVNKKSEPVISKVP